MTQEKNVITRRDFLRAGTCAALGGLIGWPLLGRASAKQGGESRVVLIRDKRVIDQAGSVQPDILEKMFDEAVAVLLDASNPSSAWNGLVSPEDVVGIKSNVWHYLPTPDALEEIIRERLLGTGVTQENISVDDRGVLRNSVFQRATALINARPMRTHHWSGLGTLLKNYIMFVPDPPAYHDNACERLGAIWKLPHVAGKTRLNILVMLTPQFHGVGPHSFTRKYTWPYGGLIVSTDPVAADATGARIIQAKRSLFFGEERPISPPPHHIGAADLRFGLGNSHPDRIRLIKLGWEGDILI